MRPAAERLWKLSAAGLNINLPEDITLLRQFSISMSQLFERAESEIL